MPTEKTSRKTSDDQQLSRTAGLTTSRIQSLGDSIFAFAMTLLVLNFRLPTEGGVHDTAHILTELGPHFIVYVISFIALGVLWVAQHNQYYWIHRSDRNFLWINIFFFMFVVLIPFSTDLLATYNKDILSVVFYGVNLMLSMSLLYLHWWYATHKNMLVTNQPSPLIVFRLKSRMRFVIATTILAILVSFFSISAGILILILVQILSIVPALVIDKIIVFHHRNIRRSPQMES